jgi:hypothetical protein
MVIAPPDGSAYKEMPNAMVMGWILRHAVEHPQPPAGDVRPTFNGIRRRYESSRSMYRQVPEL